MVTIATLLDYCITLKWPWLLWPCSTLGTCRYQNFSLTLYYRFSCTLNLMVTIATLLEHCVTLKWPLPLWPCSDLWNLWKEMAYEFSLSKNLILIISIVFNHYFFREFAFEVDHYCSILITKVKNYFSNKVTSINT